MDEYRKYEPIFGSWYIKRLLGKGSFGKVFEITREEYGTTYRAALKIISIPQDEADVKSRLAEGTDIDSVSEYYESVLKEIINENEIMSKLKGNSNIVSYEDHQIIPHEDGIGYDVLIRMELLTPLLDHMIMRKLSREEVVHLGIDMCKALEVCHRKNIIHRDIKPQNIFISDNGDYKLGDFGIARTMEKTTGGMSKKGTYDYMAPEVFRGEFYDSTVDICSLGLVLYTLLNGNRSPFLPPPPAKITLNDKETARMRRFRGEPLPVPAEAGQVLSDIVCKACDSDPQKRYHSVNALRRDLEDYLRNSDSQSVGTVHNADDGTVIEDNSGAFSTGRQNAVRYTGRIPVVQTGQAGNIDDAQQYGKQQYGRIQNDPNPYIQPRTEQPGNVSGGRGNRKILPRILIAAAAIAILAGIAFFILNGPGSGSDDEDAAGDVGVISDVEGISVVSCDWDWEVMEPASPDDPYIVDSIFWVRNNSQNAIVGIEYDVYSKDGDYLENARDPGATRYAYGYIAPGGSGIMVGKAWTFRKVGSSDLDPHIVSAYINNTLDGYVVPRGKIIDYHSSTDSYDVKINNENSTPVNSTAKIVMALEENGSIRNAAATGHLDSEIPGNTKGFVQKSSFIDPGLHGEFGVMDVYAIDFYAYGIDGRYYDNNEWERQ